MLFESEVEVDLSVMGAIEWSYVGSLGGELIENFAATCLRQRYPDAMQTKPAQGDGGIDVYRATSAGLCVWQIKKFVAPLSSQQKTQVKRSWVRFWKAHVELGENIASYILATPWTPTESARQWFKKLTARANFPVQWDGESFYNGLAADFPGTADRFFKGPDFLESMVNAKAILAASPVETSANLQMLDAVAKRERALHEIRDLVSDNYFVNSGIQSTIDGKLPIPGPNEAGVYYRYTSLEGNRFQVESVVPRNAQASEVDPVTISVRFDVEKGSQHEKVLQEWINWGVPFQDLPGSSQQVGGPFGDDEPHEGLLSFIVTRNTPFPAMRLQRVSSDGLLQDLMLLNIHEATRGVVGGGIRVLARSPSRVLHVEMRSGSENEPNDLSMSFEDSETLNPLEVSNDMDALLRLRSEDEFAISLDSAQLLRGTGLGHALNLAAIMRQLAIDLVDLQSHTKELLEFPPIGDVTMEQVNYVHDLADVYRGNARVSHWERTTMVVDRLDEVRQIITGDGCLVLVTRPVIRLSSNEYRLGRRLAQTMHSVALAPGIRLDEVSQGDEVELVPSGDDRITATAILDDPLEAGD